MTRPLGGSRRSEKRMTKEPGTARMQRSASGRDMKEMRPASQRRSRMGLWRTARKTWPNQAQKDSNSGLGMLWRERKGFLSRAEKYLRSRRERQRDWPPCWEAEGSWRVPRRKWICRWLAILQKLACEEGLVFSS